LGFVVIRSKGEIGRGQGRGGIKDLKYFKWRGSKGEKGGMRDVKKYLRKVDEVFACESDPGQRGWDICGQGPKPMWGRERDEPWAGGRDCQKVFPRWDFSVPARLPRKYSKSNRGREEKKSEKTMQLL